MIQFSRLRYISAVTYSVSSKPKQKTKKPKRNTKIPQPRQYGVLEKGILGISTLGFTISGLTTFIDPNAIAGLLSKQTIDAIDRSQIRTNAGSFLSYAALLGVLYLLKDQEDQFSKAPPKNKDSIVQNFKFQILCSAGLVICSLILSPVSIIFKSQGYITDDLFLSTIFCSLTLFICGFYEILRGAQRAQELNLPWGVDAAIESVKEDFSLISLLNKPPYNTAIAFSVWEGIIVTTSVVLSPFSPFVGFISDVETDFLRRFCPTGGVAYAFLAFGALLLAEKQRRDVDAFKWFNYGLFVSNLFIAFPIFLSQQEGVEFIGPNFSVVFVAIPQSIIPLYAALKQEFKN